MKALRLLIWVGGGALCAGMTLALGPVDQPEIVKHRAVIYFTVSFVGLTTGLLVWQRRPESGTGLLLTAFVLADVLSNGKWIFWNHALPVTIAYATSYLYAPLFGHLILSYPTGRLATRLDRFFVAFAYIFAALYSLLFLLFFDRQAWNARLGFACFDCAQPITHVASYDISGFRNALDWLLLPLALIFLALLIRKLVRSSPGGRRIVLPLSLVAFFAAAEFAARIALNGTPDTSSANTTWFWINTLVSLAVPLSLGLGMLWGHAARSAVADLVVDLEHSPPGSVRDVLSRRLGDPSLEVALWLPKEQIYVNRQGEKVELPMYDPDRAVTMLGPADAPIAALVHDPVLLERRSLLEAAGAAAKLALENERLQAELRAQLAELRASRARIVQAGDDERRRLERNLHDGAQQRLLGIGLALQLARAQLGAGSNDAAELLEDAEGELRRALDELRELAHGIHPAILTDQGLGPALRALAEHTRVPVRILVVPGTRFSGPVEAAIYFLASESLANVSKYAQASDVRVNVVRSNGNAVVDVEDDGVGGADPSRGSGLRGLSDRVQALDGSLRIESPLGSGTRIHAEIPCEW
jgi:signal transduction histidine kinase